MTVITHLNHPGQCDKAPIKRSPWTLPISSRNQQIKIDYCKRQIKLIRKWFGLDGDAKVVELRTLALAEEIWTKRLHWIDQGKL